MKNRKANQENSPTIKIQIKKYPKVISQGFKM